MKKILSILLITYFLFSALPALAIRDVIGENLALGKAVSASSYLEGYEPNRLTDGDVSGGWSPSSGVNHWAMVDLGAHYQIDRVVVEMRKDYDQPETRKGFEIRASASADMSDYTVLAKQGSNSIEHGGRFVGDVADQGTYRYIQVIKTDGTYFFITEIMVYGSEGNAGDKLMPAPHFTDVEGTDANSIVQLLTLLGITKGYDDNTYKPQKTVTRAEACRLIANLLGMNDIAASKQHFGDVPLSYWGAGPIDALYGLGAVSGMDDGTFMPEEKVTYGQFVKMLLSALGYQTMAQLRGGYPTGYFTMASLNKMKLQDMPKDKPLTRSEAAYILYQALDVKAAKPTEIHDDRIMYASDDSQTILNSIFNVYRYEGRVEATEYAALYGGKRLEQGKIRMGTATYRTAMDTFDLLGREITCYIQDDGDASDAIMLFCEIRLQDDTITIKADRILPGDNLYGISYYKDEQQSRISRVSLSQTVDVYYNEAYEISPTAQTVRPKNGMVRLVDANDDGQYDHVFVYEYENMIVSRTNVKDNTVSLVGQYGDYLNFCLDDDTYRIRLTDPQGYTISAMAIESEDVISVYKNADNDFVWLSVSDATVSGAVDTLSDDCAIIDGTELRFSASYLQALKENLYGAKKMSVGQQVCVLLDNEGKIAGISGNAKDRVGSFLEYGYLASAKSTAGVDKTLTLLVADQNGLLQEMECSGTIQLNGTVTKHDDLANALRTSAHNGVYGQLIRYHRNALGKISSIYTSASSVPDEGIVMGEAETEYYYHAPTQALYKVSGDSAPQYFISDSTLMFTVPRYSAESESEMRNQKHYSVTNREGLGNYVHYNAEGYNANRAGIAEVVVHYVKPLSFDDGTDALKETHGPVLLVDEIVTAVNGENEEYAKLYAYQDGERKSYQFDASAEMNQFRFIGALGESKHALERGDVIRCSVRDNMITSAVILFRSAEPMALSNGKVWDDESVYPPVTRTICGVLKNIYGTYMELALGDPLSGDSDSFKTERYDYVKGSLYLYDTQTKRLSELSVLELPQYIYSADSAARVFVRTHYGAAQFILVVK